jgi:hypothetical protein
MGNGCRGERCDFGMIVRWRNLDYVHSDEVKVSETANDAHRLS